MSAKKKRSFRGFLLAVNLVLLALVLLLAYFLFRENNDASPSQLFQDAAAAQGLYHGQSADSFTLDVETVKEAVAPAAKMISYEYFYTDVGVYEKSRTLSATGTKIPFTTDKTVYSYSGIIGAGIRFDNITYELDTDRKLLRVSFPAPEILSHQLDHDSFEYYDIRKSIFTSSNLGDYENLRYELMAAQEKKLLRNSRFWEDVRTNTVTCVKGILTASGKVQDYRIVCAWDDD